MLYLADNAGEISFDKLLIEEIRNQYNQDKDIFFAVKEKPVINDALAEDALFFGIEKMAKVISSGSDAPGTVLEFCSREFLELYAKADLIISKGQGNFEALVGEDEDIFFLFKVKCPVVARHIGCKLGDVILKANKKKNEP